MAFNYGVVLLRKRLKVSKKIQNKILRIIVKAPCHDLHRDLEVKTIVEEISFNAKKHTNHLEAHINPNLKKIFHSYTINRRLQRTIPMDLVQ